MEKLAYFFIDDVIWCLRDITRQKPLSLFDNPFMSALKKAHDKYGLTVQLNLFYRTDFFYGSDEFTLSDVTDSYKSEWACNSDWLKLAFHAKQEFPDYPYVNADYEDVKADCESVLKEIRRFAGEESIAYILVPHWLPISKDGCRALYDCGVRIMSPSYGDRTAYNGDKSTLPYGHAARLLQNRKKETMLFTRAGKDLAIKKSISSYNHLNSEQYQQVSFKMKCIIDKETKMGFKALSGGPCLNLYKYDEIEPGFAPLIGEEYIGFATHEQYFYSDYYDYQPEYADKILLAAKILHNNGYRFITADEQIDRCYAEN